MATAADWEERFHELVRVSPQDTRGAWALIAECLQDDEELSHSIRRLVRRRRLDDDDCDDVCQQVALSLLQLFRLHPEFGLARRRAGVAPSAWLRGVVRKLARKVIDRFWHRRHAAASLDLDIAFGVLFLDLPDREACKRWIRANQLARRNVSSQAASYFRGTQYLLEKQGQGGNHANGEATSHGATLEASKRLADEYDVARATIFRDATFAAAVDTVVAACGQEAKDIILARDSEITRRTVLLLAKMAADDQHKAIEELIENGKLPSRDGEGKKATITLPREPKALAEKLIRRLGSEASAQVVAQLKKLLRAQRNNEEGRRGKGDEGTRIGDRLQVTGNSDTTDDERGMRSAECGANASFNPERRNREAGLATAATSNGQRTTDK